VNTNGSIITLVVLETIELPMDMDDVILMVVLSDTFSESVEGIMI
jgi:hypothetical protein